MNKQLIQDVQLWFQEKGIIDKSVPLKQLLKTQEEITETRDAVVRYEIATNEIDREKWIHEIKDGIGDITVTLIGVCMMEDLDFIALHDEWSINRGHSITPHYDQILENLQRNLVSARDASIMCQRWEFAHDIGCMIFDITELCGYYDLTLEECLQQAYDVISKRTGKMVNGIFLKDKP